MPGAGVWQPRVVACETSCILTSVRDTLDPNRHAKRVHSSMSITVVPNENGLVHGYSIRMGNRKVSDNNDRATDAGFPIAFCPMVSVYIRSMKFSITT